MKKEVNRFWRNKYIFIDLAVDIFSQLHITFYFINVWIYRNLNFSVDRDIE